MTDLEEDDDLCPVCDVPFPECCRVLDRIKNKARADALEEAAQLMEDVWIDFGDGFFDGAPYAADIRALKEKTP